MFNTRNLPLTTEDWAEISFSLKILTDIIIALSLPELLSQGEGGEALKLLREFFRSMRSEGPRALPAELIEGVRLAHLVVLSLHHVQHVTLSRMRRHLAVGVVRADDVQIVIDAHFHRILIPLKAAGETERDTRLLTNVLTQFSKMSNRGGSHLLFSTHTQQSR